MVAAEIMRTVSLLLAELNQTGIHANKAILYGSYANGKSSWASDIDVVVIAREFDPPCTPDRLEQLWILSGRTDSRLEPVACGEQEWLQDDSRAILEIARREGIEIPFQPLA